MLHMICYCLILLVNLLPNPETEVNAGWFFIGFVGVIFAFNFSNIAFLNSINLKKLHGDFKRWKLMRDMKALLKERAKLQETIRIKNTPFKIDAPIRINRLIHDHNAQEEQKIEIVIKNPGAKKIAENPHLTKSRRRSSRIAW